MSSSVRISLVQTQPIVEAVTLMPLVWMAVAFALVALLILIFHPREQSLEELDMIIREEDKRKKER